MKNYKISLLAGVSLLLTSCAHKDVELPEIVQVKKVEPYHKVSEGETVGSIAEKHGMTRADLVKLNNLEPPYQLYNGQRLVITVKPENTDNVPEVIAEQTPAQPQPENIEPIKQESAVEPEKDTATIDDIQPKEEVKPVVSSEYIWPVENGKSKVSQHFSNDEVDGGIIIDASVGTPVKAIADGTVVIAGIPSGEASAYGITVVVKHGAKKMMSIYANLKEADVSVGKKVKQGDKLGKVGKSGTIATKPQLYFELNDLSGPGRKAVDPEKYFPK